MQACVRVGDGVITKKAAATALEMSTRNFYRRYIAWTNGGEKELVHGNRGKKSNRAYPETFKEHALAIVREELTGYTPGARCRSAG